VSNLTCKYTAIKTTLNVSIITLSICSLAVFAQIPDFKLSGKIEQGALVLGKTLPSNNVTFDHKILPLTSQGDFVFGFSRDDDKEHQLTITNIKGSNKVTMPSAGAFTGSPFFAAKSKPK
jgi:hypothetical protein